MKSIFFLCFALTSVASHTLGATMTGKDGALRGKVNSIQGHGNTGKASNLKLIGTVEGKSYFTDYTNAYVSWMGAAEFCNSNGLHIATIETVAQNALIDAEAGRNGDVWFWLTAYRFFDDNVFYWLPSQSPFKYTGWYNGYPVPSYFNCIYAGAQGNTDNRGWFNNIPCEARHNNLFPLCESR